MVLLACACGGQAAKPTVAPEGRAATARVAQPPPGLRLPSTVKPLRAELDLSIDPAQPTFSGKATYDIVLGEPTAIVWLNATGLQIGTASAEVGGAAHAAQVVPGNDDVVGFAFDPPLPAGPARLSVAWTGPLDPDRSLGLYRVAENPGEWYVYSFFEPIDARRAFPCFDDPSAKIPWRLTLHIPKEHVALANTAIAEETSEPDGHSKRVDFEESPPLPSYLVALIIGPFDLVDGGMAGHHQTPLRLAVPRGRGAETRYARSYLPRVIGLFEDYFGMPYPYGKLDVAVVPRFWGTMEHPGLVALGQPLMLMKPEEESTERRRFSAMIAVHELAHYWFGDYVTTAWWDDTWLNEAAASWMEKKTTDALEPTWQLQVEEVATVYRAMDTDSLPSAKKIRQPVASKDDIANAFDDAITYTKGAAILRMHELWLGEERWQKVIRAFLTAHAWKNATADDFLAALAAEAGPETAAGMKGFLDRAGVPLVGVKIVCEAGTPPRLELTQTRFVPPGVRLTGDPTWSFPVCARWAAGKAKGRSCAVLSAKTGTLPLEGATGCPDWVMPNADASGYYHVAYDPASVPALLGAPLSLLERMSLYADIRALVVAGKLDAATALAAVPAMAREQNHNTLESSLGIVFVIRRDLLGETERAQLSRFLHRAYRGPFQQLGFAQRRGDSDDVRLRRSLLLRILGGTGGDTALRREATRLARRWLDDRNAVPADLAPVALELAALDGDRALFDRVLAEARKATDRRERGELLAVLGGFRDPALGSAALALVLGGDLDMRDTIGIVRQRMADGDAPAVREQAWQWLQTHWDEVMGRMREDEKMGMFNVASVWCDEGHRAQAAAFLGARAGKVEGAPRALANALERVDVCIARQELNRASIHAFLVRW